MNIGDVEIGYLGHSGFLLTYGGNRIAIDPYKISNVERVGKADIILITHSHYDHCSIDDIQKLSRAGTIVIAPVAAQSKVLRINDVDMRIIGIMGEREVDNIKIKAIPAYNLGKNFHQKDEEWLGYIIDFGKVAVYHAGDTDIIPEMKNIREIYANRKLVALLPVSGTYVMNSEEASRAAYLINPDIAIPMHYGIEGIGSIDDAQEFVRLSKENGINAMILEKI